MERLRTTKGNQDMTADTLVPRLPLLLLVLALSAPTAMAQTLPWPTDPPRAAGAPAATPAPAPMIGAPTAAPAPMMGSPMATPRPMQGPPPTAAQQECMTKFTELRTNVEKLRDVLDKVAASSRSKSDKKASREDVCKAITNYAAAEGKWTKYIVDNSARCGIPPEVGKQVKTGHAKTQSVRKNICAAGPAGGAPPAPSLSDALGTSRQPLRGDSSTTRGTFDTLSGSAIAR
jgi:hypothetical protein